jgi:hypothetical protein
LTDEWESQAQAEIDAVVTDELKAEFQRRHDEAAAALKSVNDELAELCGNVALPPLPELDVEGAEVELNDDTVATTAWTLAEESRLLKARKRY